MPVVMLACFLFSVSPVNTLTRDLIHSLHPCSQDHTSKQSARATTGNQLPPGVAVEALPVQNVLDDIELSLYGRGLRRCSMAFERGEYFSSFVVLSLANQETW